MTALATVREAPGLDLYLDQVEEGIERTLAEGAERARAIASDTMVEVRRAMGVGGGV